MELLLVVPFGVVDFTAIIILRDTIDRSLTSRRLTLSWPIKHVLLRSSASLRQNHLQVEQVRLACVLMLVLQLVDMPGVLGWFKSEIWACLSVVVTSILGGIDCEFWIVTIHVSSRVQVLLRELWAKSIVSVWYTRVIVLLSTQRIRFSSLNSLWTTLVCFCWLLTLLRRLSEIIVRWRSFTVFFHIVYKVLNRCIHDHIETLKFFIVVVFSCSIRQETYGLVIINLAFRIDLLLNWHILV